jgi:TetR/AcrR family transcriptional repressor of nem operon
MAESHRRILDESGRLFRAKGFQTLTVAEVMNAAGLTHGGFYGHFSSKDDLVPRPLLMSFKETQVAISICASISTGIFLPSS